MEVPCHWTGSKMSEPMGGGRGQPACANTKASAAAVGFRLGSWLTPLHQKKVWKTVVRRAARRRTWHSMAPRLSACTPSTRSTCAASSAASASAGSPAVLPDAPHPAQVVAQHAAAQRRHQQVRPALPAQSLQQQPSAQWQFHVTNHLGAQISCAPVLFGKEAGTRQTQQ